MSTKLRLVKAPPMLPGASHTKTAGMCRSYFNRQIQRLTDHRQVLCSPPVVCLFSVPSINSGSSLIPFLFYFTSTLRRPIISFLPSGGRSFHFYSQTADHPTSSLKMTYHPTSSLRRPIIPRLCSPSVTTAAIRVPPTVLIRKGTTNMKRVAPAFPMTMDATG